MKKYISILGSTGSIGLSTLKLIGKKNNFFSINLLCANKNYKLICNQIKKYKPRYYVVNDRVIYNKIKRKFSKQNIKVLNNFNTIKFKKSHHLTISAIPGLAGLKPTLKMIKFSKKILLANKESIICGWNLIKNDALKNKTEIIPLDSEHFSISKLLENQNIKDVKKIILTASGGPFLNFKKKELMNITPKKAIKHPKWKMGKKISVDSSTLMNKILELIEAQKLFNISNDKLDILIHPESLVHAIVQYKNGLTKFLYHETSMIVPIANALFGKKVNIDNFTNLNKDLIKDLTFRKVNQDIFPSIKLKKKINEFPSTPIIINAANEASVDLFLKKKIPFLGIYKMIMTILNNRNYKKYAIIKPKNINQIKQIDFWVRDTIIKTLRH